MKVVFDERQKLHDPSFYLVRGIPGEAAEKPARADMLLKGAQAAGSVLVAAEEFGAAPRAAIHEPRYLEFLASVYEDWHALGDVSEEVAATVRPVVRPASYPRHIIGRIGWHMMDTSCPTGQYTWEAVKASANTAVTGAALLLDGEREAYALCRPPGHHAYAGHCSGFCFLNNVAIAAQHLRQAHDRVAILDVDVHHGNGTQGIFYERADVLTVSIHGDPMDYYPFFFGHAHERGEGAGAGFNRNLPVPVKSGDDVWLTAVDAALATIKAYAPGALVVALGLDAYEHDPLMGGAVTRTGFRRIAKKIGAVGYPTLLVQEGGYLRDDLADNLTAFLAGFESGR
ncbi:MAG: histone deacetylase family protein [Fimbriimonadaceae bacterium]|nr:histone deacetylase family protein [Alphaproteobacteria bacterium]